MLLKPKRYESRVRYTNRVSEVPATYCAEAGNPDIQVPETPNREDGQRARRAEEEEAAEAGNPDIRVPEILKREDDSVQGAQRVERTWNGERQRDQRTAKSGRT
ncbi:hypothetical protein NDU88_002867 [Pleurodeles waltl]|uniref:Uncharacterized protein n=1 Tax=Pleurodeles waltl TaxID=8319 RepID=A0AAV7KVF4_PLEWA|nr:hypothetical protein NDU88_002867 [Pleurodeles waltl]